MSEKLVSGPNKGLSKDPYQPPPPTYVTNTNTTIESTSTAPPTFLTRFACLSLHMTDRIRLLRFPAADVALVRQLVLETWPRGIQATRVYGESQEMKLNGRPWSSGGWNFDRTHARRLVCALLEGLFDVGWVLKSEVDISKKEHCQDSLLFRHQTPAPPPCTWLSISFDKDDILRMIDAPSDLSTTIIQMFTNLNKVQSHEFLAGGAEVEIKFRGSPWKPSGTETVQLRLILLTLLDCLEEYGFSLYSSLKQDNGPGGDAHATAADSWFCCRGRDWVKGVPVYHS